jgi:predicted GH43/DUF377 family glycosyl hydrolase
MLGCLLRRLAGSLWSEQPAHLLVLEQHGAALRSNFSEGASAGEDSYLIGGVTVPLITSQLLTGKTSFVQKTDTGFPNGTVVYELGLSLVDQEDTYLVAWRQMYVYSPES